MICLLPGVLGFVAFGLFDINKIRWQRRELNLLFAVGSLLLAASTLLCIPQPGHWAIFRGFWGAAALAGLILSGAALVYVLFFALPFSSTYTESEELPLVDRGAYGLCRHPSFWLFVVFYFFLWLFFTGWRLFAGFVIYNICNFLYIYLQDRYIFPRYIRGYDDYKRSVPFLIPTRASLKKAFPAKRP